MLKILEAGCLLTALTLAAPALAQEGEPEQLGPETSEEIAEDTIDAAEEDVEEEKFPIGGSLSLGYSFDQSNFTAAFTERDSSVAEQYGLDEGSTPEGSQFLNLNIGLSYSPVKKVSVTAGIGVLKTLADGYLGGSAGSALVNHETNLTDLSLGARWGFFTVPVAEIKLSLSGGLRLPTSKGSITQGLITGTRVGLGASRKVGPVNISLSGGFSYNVWDDPTQQIDLRFADLVRISGADLGRPLPLSGWSTGLNLSYQIIDDLSLSVGYQLSNRISSIEGPDDEFTSPTGIAQTGVQYGTGAHAFNASLDYSLPFDTGTSIGVSMATAQGLYSADNQRITNPFFDTETAQGAYTGYSISVSQSL